MNTNYKIHTKYFIRSYNHKLREFVLNEIQLNVDDYLFYAQVDATIQTAFNKYNLSAPKYVIVNKGMNKIVFSIFRDNIDDIQELQKWNECWFYLNDELTRQAECNSHDIEYEFKLI